MKISHVVESADNKVAPVSAPLKIQPTRTQPKQNVHVAPEKKTPAAVIHIGKKDINEFSPIKPPTAGAFGGNKDYGQPTSSRYLGNNKFVLGTTNNYVLTATVDKWGLEWDEDDEIWFLDSPGAVYIADATEGEIELPSPQEQRNQIHDLVSDYLNARNSAELQKVAAYYGHSADGEMATSEGIRVANQQIPGTKNRAQSAYYPTNVKPKVPRLDKPLTDQELARLAQLAGIKSK